jgi:hypothetical protein
MSRPQVTRSCGGNFQNSTFGGEPESGPCILVIDYAVVTAGNRFQGFVTDTHGCFLL